MSEEVDLLNDRWDPEGSASRFCTKNNFESHQGEQDGQKHQDNHEQKYPLSDGNDNIMVSSYSDQPSDDTKSPDDHGETNRNVFQTEIPNDVSRPSSVISTVNAANMTTSKPALMPISRESVKIEEFDDGQAKEELTQSSESFKEQLTEDGEHIEIHVEEEELSKDPSTDGAQDDDSGWDTDLEMEDEKSMYDVSGRYVYLETCKELGVVPVSYFMRHMHEPDMVMKHHGLGEAGAKAMAVPLVTNTSIVVLDLEDNSLGPPGAKCLADMLKENCYISELGLGFNHIGSEGLGAIASMLKTNVNIRKLNLAGNDLKDKDADVLANILMENDLIRYLDLSHNELCEEAGELIGPVISENEALESLDLSWNHLRRRGAESICEGVQNNMRLKTLDLSWNGFGNEGAVAMASALKFNSTLTELNLSDNRITAEGAFMLGKGLDANESLKILRVGNNPIGTAGAFALLKAINNERSVLTLLDLSGVFVDKEFDALEKEMIENRGLTVIHAGVIGNYVITGKYAKKAGADDLTKDPVFLLRQHCEKKDIRMVDLFRNFDKNGDYKVTKEEFKKGIKVAGINLDDQQILDLVERLDKCPDGRIDYSEICASERDHIEEKRKIQNARKEKTKKSKKSSKKRK
ncbi:leucine-rich repeat-containing protein 74B-like [Lingula anatina]|uniref:Leucine-rich repeat-containing protein 74B-like n=1 Tax=Lingula anatina TaxID=7574 RepID=A0A1S3J7G8_LINAN|nr:leucine-rich repeat-containing protein 74B-like [Lingula anatina]|eukprot:XP_013406253.1 leucine-rich repeat-containing protein 74B-like [Lingula anatina]